MTIKSAILPLAIALGLSAQSPMQVQVIQPLNFGNLVVSNAGGAIRLTEEGILNPLSGEIWQGMKSFPTFLNTSNKSNKTREPTNPLKLFFKTRRAKICRNQSPNQKQLKPSIL